MRRNHSFEAPFLFQLKPIRDINDAYFSLAAIAVNAVASTGMMSAPAQARDYPFCINGDPYDGAIRYCSFDTYKQCLATASGLKAYCEANPFFAYPEKPRIDYPRKPRRH